MKKRIICMLLAALMLFSVTGCKSGKDTTSDVVSYITEYEDVYVDGEVVEDADGKDTTGSKVTSVVGGKNPSGSTGNSGTSSVASVGGGTSVKGLNFGGKTFRKTIIGAIPNVTMRRIEAFEKKYNCNIELVSLQWEQFNSQCATAVAAGTPYDICGAQSYFWPEAGVKGLYEPLNAYIAKEDLYNAKTGIGIDLDVSSEFKLGDAYYAVSGHSNNTGSMLTVWYYNKLLFEEAGLEDPYDVWKRGDWTWDYFINLAKTVYNKETGECLTSQTDFNVSHWLLSNGWEMAVEKNGKVKENTSDKKLTTALKVLQEQLLPYIGSNKMSSDTPTDFYNGTQYMYCWGWTSGTFYMYDSICNSSAFGKDFKNLGLVPWPTGPDNTKKLNPGSGPQGKAAGKGTSKTGDPRVVIAWVKFDNEFKDPMRDEDPAMYDAKYYDVINKMFDSVIDTLPNYKTSSQTVGSLYSKITEEAMKADGNYIQQITANAKNIQAIIDDSLGKYNK